MTQRHSFEHKIVNLLNVNEGTTCFEAQHLPVSYFHFLQLCVLVLQLLLELLFAQTQVIQLPPELSLLSCLLLQLLLELLFGLSSFLTLLANLIIASLQGLGQNQRRQFL